MMKEQTKISKKMRDRVIERDSYDGRTCCRVCGSPDYIELHHIVTRGAGGKGEERNLISLCHGCHMAFHQGDLEVKCRINEVMISMYPDWDREDQRI